MVLLIQHWLFQLAIFILVSYQKAFKANSSKIVCVSIAKTNINSQIRKNKTGLVCKFVNILFLRFFFFSLSPKIVFCV